MKLPENVGHKTRKKWFDLGDDVNPNVFSGHLFEHFALLFQSTSDFMVNFMDKR